MGWTDFCSTFAPQSGPIRLGAFTSSRAGLGRFDFRATLAMSNTIAQYRTTATGPVSALTQMLAEAGINLEIRAFHQFREGGRTYTFALTERRGRSKWAMGVGTDATESACRAMIAGANRSLA
ncbi:2-isopropylmalate synthase [Rhodococcus sp. NPDC058521]|uniref:2-isopropylmalate synthase n=1 Tax=Rhodococcus sp. NPDC058521 TaxID=3346536 RepID=UPI0036653048